MIFHFLATVPPEAQRVFESNITLVGSRERQQEPSLFSLPRTGRKCTASASTAMNDGGFEVLLAAADGPAPARAEAGDAPVAAPGQGGPDDYAWLAGRGAASCCSPRGVACGCWSIQRLACLVLSFRVVTSGVQSSSRPTVLCICATLYSDRFGPSRESQSSLTRSTFHAPITAYKRTVISYSFLKYRPSDKGHDK